MSEEETQEEWEIEILAFVKGTEQAKAAICEVCATLLNYPLTYIDSKLTKQLEQGKDDSSDNCTACKKALQKLRIRRQAEQRLKELKEKGKTEL